MPQVKKETYFNNFIQSGYEELKEWTPTYYQAIKEADANMQFAGKTIDQMAQSLEDWCSNMFIDTMSEEMIQRMEEFYSMDNSGRTLDERRGLLKAAQIGSGKVDADRIKRVLRSYADADCEIDFVHTLDITLYSNNKLIRVENIKKIIRNLLPAHIAWQLYQAMQQNDTITPVVAVRNTYIACPIREEDDNATDI